MTPSQKLRSIADSTGLDGIADAIREIAEEIEHINAPAVPDETIAAMWSLYADTNTVMRLERSQFAHLVRITAKLLAATPAPAPAQGEPFGYFRAEPFGWTDCAATDEGAIALYEHPAKPAQEVGLTGYIPLLEEVVSSLEDYKNDAPWGSWDRERLERLYAIIAALRAKGGKHA